MSSVSPKTERKNKLNSIQESINRLKESADIYKRDGNTVAMKSALKVMKCLESKKSQIK